jgi:hypothetical protein
MDETQSNPITTDPPQPTERAPSPLVEAIRSELLSLANDPNLETKLSSIAQVATRASELLLAVRVDPKMVRMNPTGLQNIGSTYSVPYSVQGGSGNVIGVSSSGPAIAGPEQFGATAIRQLVNLVPEAIEGMRRAQLEDPAKLVAAIATAKERGLDALADKLERRLLDLDDDPEPEPSTRALPPGPPAHVNGEASPS